MNDPKAFANNREATKGAGRGGRPVWNVPGVISLDKCLKRIQGFSEWCSIKRCHQRRHISTPKAVNNTIKRTSVCCWQCHGRYLLDTWDVKRGEKQEKEATAWQGISSSQYPWEELSKLGKLHTRKRCDWLKKNLSYAINNFFPSWIGFLPYIILP